MSIIATALYRWRKGSKGTLSSRAPLANQHLSRLLIDVHHLGCEEWYLIRPNIADISLQYWSITYSGAEADGWKVASPHKTNVLFEDHASACI